MQVGPCEPCYLFCVLQFVDLRADWNKYIYIYLHLWLKKITKLSMYSDATLQDLTNNECISII